MTSLRAPKMSTPWMELLSPLLYSQDGKAGLATLNSYPPLYWSTRPVLVALAEKGALISKSECPFAVDETCSNELAFLDLCFIYTWACTLFNDARREGFTENGARLLKRCKGGLQHIAASPWLLAANRTLLPTCLQEEHLTKCISELTAWIAVFFIRGKISADSPYTNEGGAAKLLSFFHALSPEDISETKQEEFVELLNFLYCTQAYREIPDPKYVRCLECFGKKIANKFPDMKIWAKEHKIMCSTDHGYLVRQHPAEEPHIDIRKEVSASAAFAQLAETSTTLFSDAFFPVVSGVRLKVE